MSSEEQRISETTVWTKLIKIFYRNNCSSSISFIQKSLFFPPIVCVVFFFHQKKNSQWLKIRNLSPTKGIANEDDPQIQKQEQLGNSQQEPAVKLCWPKTMKESSIINRGSCIMIQICHDCLSNKWNHQIKKCHCWPFFQTHFCKLNCIK